MNKEILKNYIHEQIVLDMSEVPLFNLIGVYAELNKYDAVYFKVKSIKRRPMPRSIDEIEYGYMQYIHLYKDNELEISIYYDDEDMGAIAGRPYYELYDLCEIERFGTSEEEELDLYDKVRQLISR